MNQLRKIFRNPASDLLLVFGLAISCIILLNISDLIGKISVEKQAVNAYTYSMSIGIFGKMGEEQSSFMVQKLDVFNEGNIYLTKSVHIDRQRDGKLAYVLMSDNEKLLLDYKKGGYKKGEAYKNAVIIGESLEKYIKEDNGKKYIDIDNDRFNVIGILENKMSAGIDSSIFVLWDTMDEAIKENWLENDFGTHEIYYESNVSEGTFFETLSSEALQYGIELDNYSSKKNETDYQNEWYKVTNKILLAIGLVFSIFTTFSVSYLWLLNRKRELAVRMSYGYSSYHIFKLLFKDTVYLIIPAFLLSVVVQLIYGVIFDKAVLFGEAFLLRMFVIFIGIFGIVMVNTLYLMRKLKSFSIMMINEEK